MISGTFKFLIGFFIGVSILAGCGAAAGYYFFTKLAALPPRPVFAEEKPKPKPIAKAKTTNPKKPNAAASPQASPETSTTSEKLEPGQYIARVTWEEGLSLRESAGQDANRIGGVEYNQRIVVLGESDDKKWQKIRLADGEQVGWIKAGNIEKVDETQDVPSTDTPQ